MNTSPPLPSLSRVLVNLAAIVIVLGGVRVAAPILKSLLFALILSLLFSPIYGWLRRAAGSTPIALLLILVGLSALFGVLF